MDTDALLIELVEALQAQTAVMADQAEAINRLADSNQQLIAAMAAAEGDEYDDEAPVRTYLDGTPCV